MPAVSGTVVVEVLDTSWMVPEEGAAYGQALAIQFAGTLLVTNVIDGTHVELLNLGYTGNAAPGTVIPSGSKVSPSGVEGPAGADAGNAFLIVNNLSEGDLTTKQANLGIGPSGGHADSFFFQVSKNLIEGVPATMRTNLGLGTAAVKDAGIANLKLPPVDQVAGLTAGQAIFATASGVESLTAAAARTALGIVSNSGSYAILRFKLPSGTASGSFSNVGTVQVPLNDIYKDDDGIIIALAANRFSLNVGTYRIRAVVPGYLVDLFQSLLFDFSNTVALAYGTNGDATIDVTTPGYSQTGYSFLDWRWTVPASPTVYELQAKCTTLNGTNGWGQAKSFGGAFDEVYINVEILKEA